MSKIHLSEDDNALSKHDNNNSSSSSSSSSEDEQTRVSIRKDSFLSTHKCWEEMKLFIRGEVHHTVHQVVVETVVPLLSEVVKQEIELALEKFLTSLKQNSGSGIHPLESRSFQLKFLNKLSHPVFTGIHIKGEGDTPIRVALVDSITEKVINSGPEASAKVEIVVVDGDFGGDNKSNWTLEEFNNKIVLEKDGRKSLLTGKAFLYLKEGIGFVGEISITHNANWMKRCKLRLGAKIVDNLYGTRVREAITEFFFVKDRRLTLNGKHYPPSQHDEVWRLEKIGRDGSFHVRLDRENIKTVEGFLTQWFVNPKRLRDILGTTMSDKFLEATVNHAQTCILDKRLYLYFPISSQKKTGVVFNVVGQVMGLISECCYIPNDKLSKAQKDDAHKLVVSAFEHKEDIQSFDDETSMHASLKLPNAGYRSNSPRLEGPGSCYFEASNIDDGHDHTRPSTSSHTNEVVYFDAETSLGCASLHLSDAAHPSNSTRMDDRYFQPSTSSLGIGSIIDFGSGSTSGLHSVEDDINDQPLSFPGNSINPWLFYPESTPVPFFHEDELFQYFNTDHSLQCQNSNLDQPLSFPGNSINPWLFHSESMPVPFFHEEELFQYFNTDHSLQCQNSNLESQGDLQSVVNGFMLARAAAATAAAGKAQRRWTKLFSVLRWNSIRKIVASKSVSSVRIHAPKRPKIC